MKSHFLPLLSLILLSPFHLSASDNHQGIYDSESEDESSDQPGYFVTDNNNPNDMQNQHEDEPNDQPEYFGTENNNPNDHEDEPSDQPDYFGTENNKPNDHENESSDESNHPFINNNNDMGSNMQHTYSDRLENLKILIFFSSDLRRFLSIINRMSPHDLNKSVRSLNLFSQSSRPQDSEPSQSRSNIQEKPEGLDMTIIRFFSNKIQYYMNKNFFGILKKFARENKRLQNIIKTHQQALQPIFTNPFGDNNIVTSIEFSPYNTSSKTSSTNTKPPSITKNIPFLMLVFTTHKILTLKL